MFRKYGEILGMNARQAEYAPLNSAKSKALSNSKHATKLLLEEHDLATAKTFAVLGNMEELNDFDWSTLQANFVIKPTNGLGGRGIVAYRGMCNDGKSWLDTMGVKWTLDDIKMHCMAILEGQYTSVGSENRVIIEERVPIHSKLIKYVYNGTPDIRVIVYNDVPVMAMLRLPTKESEGRANLTQGAIGVGIDMATGITTYATINKDREIKYLPDTKKKLNGIKIPFWNEVLKLAVEASKAAGLGFSGVDIFLHEEKGPMVVELNASPGLSIQNCNRAGLKTRLERLNNLNVLSADHGVRIAQALFAESFADKIKAKDGLRIVNPFEEISLYKDKKEYLAVPALINTGRSKSIIAESLVKKLKEGDLEETLWFVSEASGDKLPVVEIKYKLKNQIKKTTMIVSKRLNSRKYKVQIGRSDLDNFLVGNDQSN
ncbi:MAG: hypothetical protein LBG64_03275 [Pseudomonadales bacterium]|jgi:alpha-L-glutamate ligase-like protein|nr:hypothetical protein [Pseudomonadales bacterium]